MKKRNYILSFLCVLGTLAGFSQNLIFPQEYIFEQYKNSSYTLFSKDTLQHTALFPNRNIQPVDFDKANFYKENRNWLARKVLQDNLVMIDKMDTLAGEVNRFRFSADPIFDFRFGKTADRSPNTNCYTNTRGVIATLGINENFYVETAFIENQSTFPAYVDSVVRYSGDVLGQGRWKKFKTDGYDYAMASGVMWWKPAKFFEIYLGHGKQKIGNGYRSLILSDMAFNYPYARFDFNIEKAHIKYTSTYALLMNLAFVPQNGGAQSTPKGTERLFQKKPFSYQYISWTPHRNFSMGIFQGMIWKPADEHNRLNPGLDFVNPVIGINPALYGFDSIPKILLGIDGSVKLTKKLHAYFQFVSDGSKKYYNNQAGYGWQFGVKAFDAFTLKNLFVQLEANSGQNALYASNSPGSVDYTHYNSLLTYPMYNVNSNEFIGILAYRYKRLLASAKANYLYDNNAENVISVDGRVSFILMPKTNMNVFAGYTRRTENGNHPFSHLPNAELIYFGFKTSLYNIYFDF